LSVIGASAAIIDTDYQLASRSARPAASAAVGGRPTQISGACRRRASRRGATPSARRPRKGLSHGLLVFTQRGANRAITHA
jgi:hypothetical protein